MKSVLFALALGALPALAQDMSDPSGLPPVEAPVGVAVAEGAILRGLDKVTGQTQDFDLAAGESARLGRITITLGECRYPADDPASNAFAWITIDDDAVSAPAFQGWMIAAAPALSALDHPRYDVWLIRCRLPEAPQTDG